jgi:hypothetical protein
MRWLSEQEYRQSGAEATGLTFNVAFLREIKTDFDFRTLLNKVYCRLRPKGIQEIPAPREVADLLGELRDSMETYFTLEECYGYFTEAETQNPRVSQRASRLHGEHETLYLQLSAVIEISQQLVYSECGPESSVATVADQFEVFCKDLADHEQSEMDLMMELCNEDLGGYG